MRMPPFTQRFFERSCLELAPELLGAQLVSQLETGEELRARIVELEAYLGDGSDPAAHSHRGPTPRSASMFGPAGHFYVYRSMGIHFCVNLVCEPPGRGSAILLRAAAPLSGFAVMAERRGRERPRPNPRDWLSGPGKLCQAYGITRALDGQSALRGPLRLRPGPAPSEVILCGPRIGIRHARELPYRFFLGGDPHVSRSTLNPRALPYAPALHSGSAERRSLRYRSPQSQEAH